MKLASLKHGRDGRLVVVSRDLTHYVAVPDIAATMQAALDDWANAAPSLRDVSDALNAGQRPDAHPFKPEECAAPLPRAYQWVDGSAYLNHVELVRKARNAEMPPSFYTDPLMYQGGSDDMLGARDPITIRDESWGTDLEAEVAVITDDVAIGVTAEEAAKHVRLVMLVNDVSLRNLIPNELGKGFGFVLSKPASAFSPVAVTPDELEGHWHDNRLHLPLRVWLNGEWFGEPNAGEEMTFSHADLIAHLARTRRLGAGSIVGSGTISNKDRTRGSCCLAEVRMIETIEQGVAKTPFLKAGDTVRIDMLDAVGNSIFGSIEQKVVLGAR
ncbi:fumarylacetoacetate hydrolase family protein [Chitinimonas sp. BJB300]|uniref:fumarylacetoacetate hydrolase family protein n=1 Tax=Chitinimonas sp. BJB300 TaxID=1559339 RepID=UPI000C105033|nr:fumarylacetoacetate hydrolase family protein [Chitinimonas sp. BJB300]PHV10672.1 2-keto-4-pentenoate hydratase [Chitinimonas sp. BJB300]TSJ84494.1 fumarylacetoacetate hydrolase family protein [Chitinimonas sp. BJB300]